MMVLPLPPPRTTSTAATHSLINSSDVFTSPPRPNCRRPAGRPLPLTRPDQCPRPLPHGQARAQARDTDPARCGVTTNTTTYTTIVKYMKLLGISFCAFKVLQQRGWSDVITPKYFLKLTPKSLDGSTWNFAKLMGPPTQYLKKMTGSGQVMGLRCNKWNNLRSIFSARLYCQQFGGEIVLSTVWHVVIDWNGDLYVGQQMPASDL